MKHIITSMTLLFVLISNAQESKLKKANQKYDDLSYIDAAKVYLQVAESGYKSEELFKKIGNTYYFKADYKDAEKWYGELYKLNSKTLETEYLLRYSQSLKAVGKEKKAEHVYDQFLNASGILNKEFSSSSDYLKIIEENSNRYNINPLPINSNNVDYGAFMHENTIYFSSTRNLKKRRSVDVWSNEPFLDIYSVHYNKDENTYDEPVAIKGDVNNRFHESSPAITKDGKTMYFTRTNSTPRIKTNKKDKVQLKIYRATKVGDEWTNIEDLSINGDNYSNVHPALSPDENTLYFASNMPLSIGQTDIFSVAINKDGSFGKPKNLGPKVNTKGRESFPFITNNYELYFSSDGHFGLGGYDVFYMDLKATGKQLLNVGMPVNGPTDDFAFSINNHTKTGFFSSNRTEVDNIYGFTETKSIKELLEAVVTGVVTDKATGLPIAYATLTINSDDNTIKYDIAAKEDGSFSTTINKFKAHTITVKNKGYDTTDAFIAKGEDAYQVDIQLVQNVFEISADAMSDLAKMLNTSHIYFDLNKSSIKKEAEIELEKIIAVMKQYPNLRIDVRSHTDSRANDSYNMILSNKRAKATINYLITRGINKDRLTGKGYGESQLLNGCKNGTTCTEAQHQENRRSEFIVLQN